MRSGLRRATGYIIDVGFYLSLFALELLIIGLAVFSGAGFLLIVKAPLVSGGALQTVETVTLSSLSCVFALIFVVIAVIVPYVCVKKWKAIPPVR